MARRRRTVNVRVVKRKRRGKVQFVLRWTDPGTGETRERATDHRRRRAAEQEANELTQRFQSSLSADDTTWSQFCDLYEDKHLPSLAKRSGNPWRACKNHLQAACSPEWLDDVDEVMLGDFAQYLRKAKYPETTIATYLGHLRAALNWAADMNLIDRVPRFRMPKRAKGVSKAMRSRPITREEFERILMATRKVRPKDYRLWRRFLRGLWESGLRVSELRTLSWDASADLSLDSSGEYPVIRIGASGEKGHRDRFQPITPEFWHLCEKTRPERRSGPVFSLRPNGKQLALNVIVRNISAIGKRANVVTNAMEGKYASSHDIGRRALTTRLGAHLSQAELAKWMRHASPQTTMQYYMHLEAQALAAKMWPNKSDQNGDHASKDNNSSAQAD